jgi:hypothetical protein
MFFFFFSCLVVDRQQKEEQFLPVDIVPLPAPLPNNEDEESRNSLAILTGRVLQHKMKTKEVAALSL